MEAPKNPNYAATVVKLDTFIDLPNCDNVKHALIFGNAVIVAKDTPIGELGLYFPPECAISSEFLSNNNIYRKAEFGNKDPDKTGFFEQHGRVKTMKFRGHKSEGFYASIDHLVYIADDLPISLEIGDTFDQIRGHEICRKYIPRGQRTGGLGNGTPKAKAAKLEDSIVDGQFRLHFDTEQLRRNIFKIKPTDIISISDKWHGTSVVIGKLLVKRNLSWFEKVLKKFGVGIVENVYGLTYSSRRVIKAVNGKTKEANHFYTTDIWGDVAQEVADKILDGITLYGEIVGFTKDGSPIQGGYPYGCKPFEHKFLVYRITSTNDQGKVIELSWPQMTEYCQKFGLEIVPTFYYGVAEYLFYQELSYYPEFTDDRDWQKDFLALLEKKYANDGNCPYNPPKTPAEGVVVRIDHLEEAQSFKLKNFRFLSQESANNDKEILDIETIESSYN